MPGGNQQITLMDHQRIFCYWRSSTDLLVADDGVYITKIRDFGSTVTGSVFVEIEGTQSIKTTFNDTHEDILSGVTEASPNSNVLRDVNFGGIGHSFRF